MTTTTNNGLEAAVFDVLARDGVSTVTVTFTGDWGYNELQDIMIAYEEGKTGEACLEDFVESDGKPTVISGMYQGEPHTDINLRDAVDLIWDDKADAASYGYDDYHKYEPGEYYQGTDDDGDGGTVTFNVAERQIELEIDVKVKVVEYRTDHKSLAWDLDDSEAFENTGPTLKAFLGDDEQQSKDA